MQILRAMLLGLIQGFSEFMPVSSSGNLYFFSSLFNIDAYTLSFNILLHTATLAALIFIYFKDIRAMIANPTSHLNKMVAVGIIPIFVVSVIFQMKIDTFFYASKALGVCFIFSGVVLFYETMYSPGKKKFKNMKIKDALIIGAFQTVGVIPAVSRNGMALCGGLQRGFDGKTSLKYAYLMSIPAMLGRIFADVLMIYNNTDSTVTDVFGAFSMLFGFIAAFAAGVVAIRIMQRLAAKGKFRIFSYYMWIIGLITLIDMLSLNKIF